MTSEPYEELHIAYDPQTQRVKFRVRTPDLTYRGSINSPPGELERGFLFRPPRELTTLSLHKRFIRNGQPYDIYATCQFDLFGHFHSGYLQISTGKKIFERELHRLERLDGLQRRVLEAMEEYFKDVKKSTLPPGFVNLQQTFSRLI